MYVKEFVKITDNSEDPPLSTEDLIFLLSNTHYRC